MVTEKEKPFSLPRDHLEELNDLVLFNDEVNTFDWVIDSLVELCEHEPEQAEQCALIAHLKGKCQVKKGEFKELAPIQKSLSDRGLTVEIN